jgi:glycosyltransferase involved in cell wall biosynthesis
MSPRSPVGLAPRAGAGRRRLPARIVQIAVTPTRSGTEQIVLDLSERLVAEGGEVAVVVPTGSGELDGMAREARERGAAVFRVSPLYPGDRDPWRNLRQLHGLLRQLRPALVHYHVPRAFSGFESVLAGRLARVPRRVRTDHNPVVQPPTRAQLVRLRVADAMVDRVVLVSSDNLRNHLQTCARPAAKCVVIPNGVDVRTIAQAGAGRERTALRRRLGLPEDATIGVMVGALSERKGALDFVGAARAAVRAAPTLHCAVVGDGEALPRMRELAASEGLQRRMHFLGRRSDVRRILPAFDLFVLPSHYEGMALTMLEALAAGLPLVTTRVDGVADVLPGEQGALFVDRYDTEALGAAMARLAGDPCLRRALVARAQPRVRKEFSAEALYERYRSLYQRLGVELG